MRRFLLVYFALSVLLGLMEITDGVYLSRAPAGCISALFGMLEIVWGAVSVAAVVSCVKLRVNWLAPVSFVVYICFAFFYSFPLLSEPEIPRWVAIQGAIFGAYFAAVSLWAFMRLREPRPSADASDRTRPASRRTGTAPPSREAPAARESHLDLDPDRS